MFHKIFYSIKPFIPRSVQLFVRRRFASLKRTKYRNVWPIDPEAGDPPQGWAGWPDAKRFALVLSHDVDTQKGHDRALKLLAIEKEFGFKSAFNIVPERYTVSPDLITEIKKEGFEVNVHGLKHDGKLFHSKHIFQKRAQKINTYLQQWGASGFTAPSMICNIDWIHGLNINYSTCTFDTDPFEPIPTPSKTIFPYAIRNNSGSIFLELPYTLPQDHTLFIIMKEKDITIWKQKLSWIAQKGGMALLNTHPDYMKFHDVERGTEEYPLELYMDFLRHIKQVYEGQYWHALPSEIYNFIKSAGGLH